jgi:uncharacterized membrane protein YhaH (DUF805 family)
MDFTEAVKSVYSKYATFNGRARRSEYWWWALYMFLTGSAVGVIEYSFGLGTGFVSSGAGEVSAVYNGGLLSGLWSLAHLLPGLAVGVRRLHDTDRSGWWLLIVLIPLIGILILLYFLLTKGSLGPNRFGDDPIR